jgi:hypothetical protein
VAWKGGVEKWHDQAARKGSVKKRRKIAALKGGV